MRKFSYLISVIFLLTQIAMFAQQFDCQITPSRYTVNRAEKIIWVDLNVYNTEVVKDIKFNVTTTYNSSTISAQPIPARCVNNDGTTDPTKWTAVTKTAVNSASFRYWMAEDVNNYVPKSTNTRCLMEFFIKFTGEIPLTGNLVISFTNFQVIGVNTINSTTMTLTTPVQSGITIDLGATPPDVNDSLQLRTEAGSVNRQTGEARIKLLYKSVIFSFNRLAFNLYPLDLDVKDIEIVDSTGRGWTLGRVGDHYEISISNTDNQGFPPTNANTMLAEIVLSFNPGATGARIIVMNNFQALDLANQTLKVTNSLQQVIDLGQPLPRGDSLYLNGVYLIDELKSEVVVDVYYWGSAWDTLAFNLNLPSGLNLKRFEPGLSSMTPVINGSRLKLSSEIKLPRVAPNDWHHAFSLVLGYNNVQGVKRLIMDNMRAQRGDTSLTVANQPVVVDIDFGNKPNDTTGIVKYSLAINNSWFSLDRPNSRGTISFLWNMENLKETTQSLIFELEVPYYMELQQVLALDAGKNVDIQKIGDQGGVKTYLVVYSTTVNNALPPNSMANNPRAIMRLFIDFVDLPPYTLIIPIKNIMAYSLDGRVINQTKEMSLVIDFLEKVYWPRFEKGDVNKQFGDGQLTQADIDKLKKFISGELVPTLYEAWASDMNNDGKINIYDLTILQNLVYGTTEVTDNTDDGIITVRGRLVSFDFTNITQVDLSVYDYLGSQIKHLSFSGGQGQADLSDIYQGVYFIKINNHLVKVLF